MMRRWITPLVAVLALIGASMVPIAPSTAAVGPATTAGAAALTGEIDGSRGDPRRDGTIAGVVVQDAATGGRLYEHNPDCRLMPASNMQMLSSAAAMEILGPDYTFTTTVHTDGVKIGRAHV